MEILVAEAVPRQMTGRKALDEKVGRASQFAEHEAATRGLGQVEHTEDATGRRSESGGVAVAGRQAQQPPVGVGACAVGPTAVVELNNLQFAVYDKLGTSTLRTSLNDFWTAAGVTPVGDGAYDPRILYDKQSGRWISAALDNPGGDGSIGFHQDASLYAAALEPGQTVKHTLAPGRAAWVQVATGAITLNGKGMSTGDGAAIEGESTLELVGVESGETLVFDLV